MSTGSPNEYWLAQRPLSTGSPNDYGFAGLGELSSAGNGGESASGLGVLSSAGGWRRVSFRVVCESACGGAKGDGGESALELGVVVVYFLFFWGGAESASGGRRGMEVIWSWVLLLSTFFFLGAQ